MKKLLIALLLIIPSFTSAEELSWEGFTLLHDVYTVGGDVYCDVTSGGYKGNWGLGTSKQLLAYDLVVGTRTYQLSLDFSYPIAFQTFTAKGLSLVYDLTPHIRSLAFISTLSGDSIKIGLWTGLRTDMNPNDTGAIIGGIRAQILKIKLLD